MKYLIVAFLLFSIITSNAQVISKGNTLKESGFQITLIYPIGTNGSFSYENTNMLSINLLGGINGGVNGFELGGFCNINRLDVRGLQMAGFGNLNGGDTKGIQMSGFGNINNGNTSGIQLAGFGSINKGDMGGLQLSGFCNINSGIGRGIQGAGFLNMNKSSEEIIQAAGFGNVTDEFNGIQAAGFFNIANNAGTRDSVHVLKKYNFYQSGIQAAGFINVARNIKGIQVAGFINVAENVEGIQVAGFINICDSLDGLSFAVVNYVKRNGYRKMSIWSNETYFINTTYKMGIKQFYTIYNLGYRPNISSLDWSVGIGLGTAVYVRDKNYIDIEGIHNTLINRRTFKDHYHSHNQIKISFRHQMNDQVGIFGGPTFNLLVTNHSQEVTNLRPSWAREFNSRYHNIYTWFGFNAGILF